jgi:hypothetical protein
VVLKRLEQQKVPLHFPGYHRPIPLSSRHFRGFLPW